jgi:hypothetical protein
MYSELFVAQHHVTPAAGGPASNRTQVGYFDSFEQASSALDEKYTPGCWQGIERRATHQLWWRDDSTEGWSGPHRRRR